MISARDEDIYVDSLYSNYHVQFSSEELLLPLLTHQPELYPTVLNKPSGLVTHMENKSPENPEPEQPANIPNVQPVNYPFHPSNFLSVAYNKRALLVQETPKKLRPSASIPRVLSSLAPPGTNLFEATYAGVEVYELMVGGNSVMRRRDDTMVNATHLLKLTKDEKLLSLFMKYALLAADEAIKDAGYTPATELEKEMTGVCIGSGIGSLQDITDGFTAFEANVYCF
ncbi:Mitochondrial beta-keto-acyl synthase [Terramyces sp. JEL0728]|nr:Mitochondrial beta-keto-acyl synthase [Terramyces sp. JEL0728]KAJ3276468.1 Mitochondrial beta-keto-acyl synthase [Terramyces sp. JEL0728]